MHLVICSYDDVYPAQTVPSKARDIPDEYDTKKADPERYEAGSDNDYSFKANYEMMKNVFQTGINPSSVRFKDEAIFPFELDKTQKPIRSLTVSKTYDADKRRWKTPDDHEKDRDLSR